MFKKVSRYQFLEDCDNSNADYDLIKIPYRATKYSAGYDFFMPYDLTLYPGNDEIVPTGIKWDTSNYPDCIRNYVFLLITPKSGLGFKYHLGLANTVGIIDADYCESDNEGHIMIKIVNNGDKTLELKKGQGFAQGILVSHIIDDDKNFFTDAQRNGGFGSTSKSI